MMTNETLTTSDAESAPTRNSVESSSEQKGQISLLDLVIVLLQYKKLIASITAAFVMAGVALSFLAPVKYTANITIMPPQGNASISSTMAQQLGGMALLMGGNLGIKDPNEMYVAMFKSESVENAMVRRFALMQQYRKSHLSDARKAFEKNVAFNANNKEGFIHISITDRDSNRAAELANGYVDQLRELSEYLAVSEAGQRRLFFQKQLDQARNQLSDAEESFKDTEQASGVIAVDSQTRALVESVASLRAKIAAQEVQLQGIQTYETNANPELLHAQRQLESLQSQLNKLGGGDNQGGDLILPKAKLPTASLQYLRKLRDVKYYETIYDIVARQFELAKLDEAKQGALIQVVDPATPPDRRSSPKRLLIIIAAAFSGILAGILTAFFLTELRRIRSDSEIAGKLHVIKSMLPFHPVAQERK